MLADAWPAASRDSASLRLGGRKVWTTGCLPSAALKAGALARRALTEYQPIPETRHDRRAMPISAAVTSFSSRGSLRAAARGSNALRKDSDNHVKVLLLANSSIADQLRTELMGSASAVLTTVSGSADAAAAIASETLRTKE